MLGRGAYEDMARAWPGSDNAMAVMMNTLPKVVFTHTLPSVSWSNARLARGPVEDDLPTLKARATGTWSASEARASPTPSPRTG